VNKILKYSILTSSLLITIVASFYLSFKSLPFIWSYVENHLPYNLIPIAEILTIWIIIYIFYVLILGYIWYHFYLWVKIIYARKERRNTGKVNK